MRTIVLSVYLFAAILEVLGIALTVSAHVKDRNSGLSNVVLRRGSRGLILIGSGALIGLGGSIAELFAS